MTSKKPPEHFALVTGTSSGIGMAVARRLLNDGWQVLGIDMAAPALGDEGFQHLSMDLRGITSNQNMLDSALNGRVPEAFIHAAGVLRVGALGSLASDAGEIMWRVHVDAATSLANILIPRMKVAKQGRVVLLGSRVSRGIAGRSQYAATKAALASLARSWAAESIADGVTVNVVSPAATDTPMLSDPARKTSTPRLPPIGRLIQPEEVASLVRFLLSPEAAAITGQDIAICGGASVQG